MKSRTTAVLLLACGAMSAATNAVVAQSQTGYDLVNAVNGLRALSGLQPYTIDAGLMAYAQEHSEYQAATNTSTHVHSDGTRPFDMGLQENVAAGTGGFMTVDIVVYQIWVDWGHRHVLIGYATGEIGAGVAAAADGSLDYTLDLRPGEELAATEAPFVGLQTSTPSRDGSIVHVVGVGETLWSIAVSYGVTIDDIRQLNNLGAAAAIINPGQKLLIRPAGAATPAPLDLSASASPEGPSATVASATATTQASETATPLPSLTTTPTDVPLPVTQGRSQSALKVALLVAIIGLAVAAAIGFWQARDDSQSDDQQ
jgi:LysM repeat protein